MNKIYLAVPVMSLLLSSVNYDIDTYSKSDKLPPNPQTSANTNVISAIDGGLADYSSGISLMSDVEDAFEKFVKDIVNDSQSMPADIAAYVNDNFWNLI